MTYTPDRIANCKKIAKKFPDLGYADGDIVAYGSGIHTYVQTWVLVPDEMPVIGGDRFTNMLVEWLSKKHYRLVPDPSALNVWYLQQFLYPVWQTVGTQVRGDIAFIGNFTSALAEAIVFLIKEKP